MNSHPTNTRAPIRIWIGALVFLLPFLSLVTKSGVSLVSHLFLLSSLALF
jgi:O-antigen ligase